MPGSARSLLSTAGSGDHAASADSQLATCSHAAVMESGLRNARGLVEIRKNASTLGHGNPTEAGPRRPLARCSVSASPCSRTGARSAFSVACFSSHEFSTRTVEELGFGGFPAVCGEAEGLRTSKREITNAPIGAGHQTSADHFAVVCRLAPRPGLNPNSYLDQEDRDRATDAGWCAGGTQTLQQDRYEQEDNSQRSIALVTF